MRIITTGATRTVFIIGRRYAIKIPKLHTPKSMFGYWGGFLQGLLSNLQEKRFSEVKWVELCPVLFSIPGGFMNIMPFCEELTEKEWLEFEFQSFVNQADRRIPVESKKDSFGKFKGNIVALDYGS